MKNFIIILIFAFVTFVGCNKISVEVEKDVSEVSFNVNVIEGYSITKGVENDKILSAIKETFPTVYYLRLKNTKNGNIYKMKSNESKYIPNGEYEITNCYENEDCVENIGIGVLAGPFCNPTNSMCVHPDFGVCKYPKIIIKETITINNNGNINLNGTINCQVFVYDNALINNIKFYKFDTDKYDIKCVNTKDNISFFYCWSRIDAEYDYYVGFVCNAKENANVETTKYWVNIVPNFGGLEYGKYYILKCTEVENSEIGGNVSVSNFSAGEDLSNYIK